MLIPDQSQITSKQTPHLAWRQLPLLCCEAAGGDPSQAQAISLAWGLLFTAAHLMDNVADGDAVPAWMAELGSGSVVNIATALYASASLALVQDLPQEIEPERALLIQRAFNRVILRMCSGQHLDLLRRPQSLDVCWRIVRAKSGAIFELACTSGAQLATGDEDLISHYGEFGNHLGIMVQICDDAADLRRKSDFSRSKLSYCSIPIAYTMKVLAEDELGHFQTCLQLSSEDGSAAGKVREIVEAAGALLYLQTKLEYHGNQAMNALEKTGAIPDGYAKLTGFVKRLQYAI